MACKLFVDPGQDRKGRYILFPQAFDLVLRVYLTTYPKSRFVCETQRCGLYKVRRVQQMCSTTGSRRPGRGCFPLPLPAPDADFLDQLEALRCPDTTPIQTRKKCLEMYQHLSLDTVESAYQQWSSGWRGEEHVL
jgi:hypothetical protein